nr:hypothetical protein [uncultured Rhodopila sp.]
MIRSLLVAALAAWFGCAQARTLEVGPGKSYASPSEAAAAAADGDTVAIAPGSYFDCAIWRQNGLTIAGTGPGVLITDRACAGKAAFVIQGNGVTIRGLSFMRIRVPDGNGAGIRAEGRDLTVEDSRFDADQIAILAGAPGGSLRIADCLFAANGGGTDERPLDAIVAGRLDLLSVSHSVFKNARSGGHINSSALRTEIIGNDLADEGGRMAGPLVSVNGGVVILTGNTFTLSAGAAARPGAVLVFGDAEALAVRGNTLTESAGQTPMVRNWGGVAAGAYGNTVPDGVEAVSESGATYHRLRARMAALRASARDAAGFARHEAAVAARGLGLIQ